jgi:phage terminase large subunit GpA-like protein
VTCGTADGGGLFAGLVAAAIRPRPRMSVWQWADRERFLSSRSSPEPGRWRTTRVPFSREIMEELSPSSPAQEVIFVASTQVVKTEIGINFIGHSVCEDPCPILAVYPTVEVGNRWVRQRLNPTITESPSLRDRFPPERSRDASNTNTLKEYPGGILIMGGANSAASLASMPIKKLMADEVDRYPRNVGKDEEGGGEGDPLDLAEARTSAFGRRAKKYKASSPTIMSLSRIWKDWLRSSQGEYHVPCPDCRELQVLRRENLNYSSGHPEEARFVCIHCSVLIEERRKSWMLDEANGARWIHKFPERALVRGYHLSAWYSPTGLGKTWPELARMYEDRKNDPERLKVFINTVDALCYEDPNEKLDWEEIKSRADASPLRTIPAGYTLLTAGVDVQKDRLEYLVMAWGRGMRRFVVDVGILPCDPMRQDWHEQLDELLLAAKFRNAYGQDLRIKAVAMDSGYLPDEVFKYTRPRKARGVFAIKGASLSGRPILLRPSKVDFKRNGVVHKQGAEQWQVGTDTAKHALFALAAGDKERADPEERLLRHSSELPDEYFRQFCAEVWDPHKRRWVKVHTRNEGLDITVYAIAAAYHPHVYGGVHKIKDPVWEKLEEILEPKAGSLFGPQPIEEPQRQEQQAPPQQEHKQPNNDAPRESGSWIGNRPDWLKR